MTNVLVMAKSLIFTLMVYLVNSLFGDKKVSIKYLIIFLGICGVFYVFGANAKEYDFITKDYEILKDHHKRELAENMKKSELNANTLFD